MIKLPDETEMKWRDLALQFDGHRMQAIGFLKMILNSLPDSEFQQARDFLKEGPLPGDEVMRNYIYAVAEFQRLKGLNAARPDNSNDGYVKAFYEIAGILGISAQPSSPKHVFETVMKPKLQDLVSTAQPVRDGWVKCSERMPEADGHYLVFANASTLDGYCDHNDIACYQQGKWSNEFNWLVTHWMPLPAAPGGQDD